MIDKKKGRLFIPSRIEDNRHLDYDSYVEGLNELDPITRRQLLMGDWNAEHLGNKFRRSWLTEVTKHDIPSAREMDLVRCWDFAATEARPGKDPDYTVGLLMGFHRDTRYWYILDIERFRGNPGEVKRRFGETCSQDFDDYEGYVTQVIEQEPGASGKYMVDDYMVTFPKYDIMSLRPSGSKEVRSNPVSSRIEAGRVYIMSASWNNDFYEEIELFPYGSHDDQVDALSGAYFSLADNSSVTSIVTIPGVTLPVYQSGELKFYGDKYIDKA